jgi:hypothetical protein
MAAQGAAQVQPVQHVRHERVFGIDVRRRVLLRIQDSLHALGERWARRVPLRLVPVLCWLLIIYRLSVSATRCTGTLYVHLGLPVLCDVVTAASLPLLILLFIIADITANVGLRLRCWRCDLGLGQSTLVSRQRC